MHVSLTFKGENLVTLSFPFRFAISQRKWTLNVAFFERQKEKFCYTSGLVYSYLFAYTPQPNPFYSKGLFTPNFSGNVSVKAWEDFVELYLLHSHPVTVLTLA